MQIDKVVSITRRTKSVRVVTDIGDVFIYTGLRNDAGQEIVSVEVRPYKGVRSLTFADMAMIRLVSDR